MKKVVRKTKADWKDDAKAAKVLLQVNNLKKESVCVFTSLLKCGAVYGHFVHV